MAVIEVDIGVIGGGSGGLSVAAGAAQMGASVALIERGRMGGDCLNTGCVPSKSLLAAAAAAAAVRGAPLFGVDAGEPKIDFGRVHDFVHGVIADIAPHDSPERFEGLGVRVIAATACFANPRELIAGNDIVRARRFVIATGSSPFIPPIPGLEDVSYLTNESIFDLKTRPPHLLVLGGGPIGIELAQAHRRLGARVTIVEMASILGKDDPELVEFVRRSLRAEGVEIRESVRVVRVDPSADGVRLRLASATGVADELAGSHLLVAVGRRPNISGLGLVEAGVAHTATGVTVDCRLRTTNRRIYAIGDVAGSFQFTHVAGYHAGIVLRNILFRLPARIDDRAVPRVTYADPELAQVGQTEDEARAAHGNIRVLRWSFAENDRARTQRNIEGMIKVVTTTRGRILGAAIVGREAGELINLWVLALSKGLSIGAVAGMIVPYPTLGEVSKRAAGSFFAPSLFGPRTRRLVRFLARFG
ncbi:MAG: dihydrolipoamide dehydrogenase [Rhodospirillaceae bacterium]|nr:dihydrolipoamide dehydrogenase [Rhodospirillaceae bacterium]